MVHFFDYDVLSYVTVVFVVAWFVTEIFCGLFRSYVLLAHIKADDRSLVRLRNVSVFYDESEECSACVKLTFPLAVICGGLVLLTFL